MPGFSFQSIMVHEMFQIGCPDYAICINIHDRGIHIYIYVCKVPSQVQIKINYAAVQLCLFK